MSSNSNYANISSSSSMGEGVKSFFSSNTLLTILLIIVILLLLTYLFTRLGYSINNYQNESPYIVEDTIQGTTAKSFPGSLLLRSSDQKFGLAFWIYIGDNTFNNTSKMHHVFHKGNSSSVPLQAPGVWIYPNENKFAIYMNTYNNVASKCDIGNIPLNKWVFMTIVVIGRHMDVYVNAKLKKRTDLGGIPKQNYGDLYMNKWGGFSGFISRFRYYSYGLQFFQIEDAFKNGPSDAPCVDTGARPPSLAPNWWMTTGFPNTQVNI
jgi:hypothetical protein